MIVEYHRPKTLREAIALLARKEILTVPMGGGSVLNRPSLEPFAVVDLQALPLNGLVARANNLLLGATLTLQTLLDYPALPPGLQKAVRHEATYNLRQVATLAGTLVAADGRSPLATALLASDAILEYRCQEAGSTPKERRIGLGEFLIRRGEGWRGRLITQVFLPLNAHLAYEYVARTPADRPIVCAAVARWPAGRIRLALGGYGPAPVMSMDGPEMGGIEMAARDAYAHAGDEWASAAYRQVMAGILAKRCLETLGYT